jgi:hypothetical protein
MEIRKLVQNLRGSIGTGMVRRTPGLSKESKGRRRRIGYAGFDTGARSGNFSPQSCCGRIGYPLVFCTEAGL